MHKTRPWLLHGLELLIVMSIAFVVGYMVANTPNNYLHTRNLMKSRIPA
ncbi:MAG: hypothetical protein OXG88_08500 [Gammaproteobacteria bacterium]|nr:hypothetical protein [Gammaproteobacteria bacterium]